MELATDISYLIHRYGSAKVYEMLYRIASAESTKEHPDRIISDVFSDLAMTVASDRLKKLEPEVIESGKILIEKENNQEARLEELLETVELILKEELDFSNLLEPKINNHIWKNLPSRSGYPKIQPIEIARAAFARKAEDPNTDCIDIKNHIEKELARHIKMQIDIYRYFTRSKAEQQETPLTNRIGSYARLRVKSGELHKLLHISDRYKEAESLICRLHKQIDSLKESEKDSELAYYRRNDSIAAVASTIQHDLEGEIKNEAIRRIALEKELIATS